jgi:Primase C terminal 2 (PriCT-2)
VKELTDEHPGIEFKSLGHQVVAAGSVHPDTLDIYRWGMLALPPTDARMVPISLTDIGSRKDRPAPACGSGLKLSVAQIRYCLSQLPPDRFEGYSDWLAVGMACHQATDGPWLQTSRPRELSILRGRLTRQWLQTWRPRHLPVRLARQWLQTWELRQLSIIWWRLARQQPSLPPRPNGSAEEDGQGKARMKRSMPRSQSSSIG